MKSGSCDIALDYNNLLEPSSTQTMIALPILNDMPLYMSVPKVQHHSLQSIIVALVWFFTFGTLCFLVITLLGRADVCRKADRLNVRDTPLTLPESFKSRYQGGSSF
jgi:hypothetical protein